MILVIDNYDSFTYNLVQYLGELGAKLSVSRNDRITLDEIRRLKPERIIISPGPGKPCDAGISEQVIASFGKEVPLLGVCLGHQAIGEVFGGKIVSARHLMHGKTSPIKHNGRELFKGICNPFDATRYHSLVIERKSFPQELVITAETDDKDKEIMGIRHKTYPVFGVQFHPESILTREGMKLIKNFLDI